MREFLDTFLFEKMEIFFIFNKKYNAILMIFYLLKNKSNHKKTKNSA